MPASLFKIVIIPVISVLFFSCMKKQCYSCYTSYPEIMQDSIVLKVRQQAYCDITAERAEYLEQIGSKDTLINKGGVLQSIKVITTCEPGS